MRFSYYDNLSDADQRIYRKSDRIRTVDVPDRTRHQRRAAALEKALAGERCAPVQDAANRLCRGLTRALEVPDVRVKVLARRPRAHDGELHGLYTWEEGKQPTIEVWMRTAEHRRVVAFRTFLRTLLHEVCHHLDFSLLGLDETFHTEGFFRRESSLMRQLAPPKRAKKPRAKPASKRAGAKSVAAKAAPKKRKRKKSSQLSLF